MSIPNSAPGAQALTTAAAPARLIAHAPDTLDFTQTLIVNSGHLRQAHSDVRHVSLRLHNVDTAARLDAEQVNDLCRTLHHAAGLLATMLDGRKEGAR